MGFLSTPHLGRIAERISLFKGNRRQKAQCYRLSILNILILSDSHTALPWSLNNAHAECKAIKMRRFIALYLDVSVTLEPVLVEEISKCLS